MDSSVGDPNGSPKDEVRVWRGPAIISVALVGLGMATYAYLTLAARVLEPEQYAQLAAFWSLVFAVLAGAFTPLELEGTRAVSAHDAWGQPVRPVIKQLALVAVVLTGVLLVALALASTLLADALFGGDTTYVILLACVAVGFSVTYLGRGLFAGRRRFGWYGAMLSGEGVVRFMAALALVVAGVASGPGIAAAVALGAGVIAVATTVLVASVVRSSPVAAVPPTLEGAAQAPPAAGVTANFWSLLIASMAAQALNNAGPITVQALGDDPQLTGGLLAAFILVRVPVMFISALQTGFVPELVAAIRRGGTSEVRSLLRSIVTRVAAVGALAVVTAGVAGPLVVGFFFGPGYQLMGVDFAVLTLATVAFVLASMLQAALVALGRHRVVAAAWVSGLVLSGAMLLLPLPLLRQVEAGYVIGTLVVLVVLSLGLSSTSAATRDD